MSRISRAKFELTKMGMVLAWAMIVGSGRSGWAEEPNAPGVTLPRIGYVDSPFLPNSRWRVHDLYRPRPSIVHVAPSPAPASPPSDAVVLFDGKDLSQWMKRVDDPQSLQPAGWEVKDGAIVVVGGSGDIQSIATFADCQLHVEWSAPTPPEGGSQGRGNSGVYLMGHYEIQILDSHENTSYADGQAGAVYGQYPPLVNVTRPPGEWNSFDIVFEAPRFSGARLERPAYVTVFQNGVLVQYHREIMGVAAHKHTTEYKPHAPAGPVLLQDHGNPTRFRNIWVRPLNLAQSADQ